MKPDKQYMALHPHRLLLNGDGSLFLKLTSPDDSEQLYKLVHENRSHLSRYQSWARDINFEQMHEAVQGAVQRITEGGWLQYRIMIPDLTHGHRMVGTVTLYGREVINGAVHLGYWLAEDAQGKSYARKAIERLLAYAVPEWQLRKVYAEIEPGNERAEGLAKRLGAKPTNRFNEENVGEQTVVRRVWEITC